MPRRAQNSALLSFALAGDASHPEASVYVQVHRVAAQEPRVVAASLRLATAADQAEGAVLLADGQVVVDMDPGGGFGGMELLTKDDEALTEAMAEAAQRFPSEQARLVRDACNTLRYFWGVAEHLLLAGLLQRPSPTPSRSLESTEPAAASQPGEWMPAFVAG